MNLPLTLGEQCCDAGGYLMLGQVCAGNGVAACWNGLRPMGAQLYLSIPFRLGLGEAGLVLLNAFVLGVSAFSTLVVVLKLLPKVGVAARLGIGAFILALHVTFAGAMVRNSLTDIPAAALVMASAACLPLASSRHRSWLYALSGFCMGFSATLRAFYLYPGILFAAVVALISLRRRGGVLDAAALLAAFAVPVGVQIGFTHAFTGAWAFIDPYFREHGARDHFEGMSYGYDTVLPGRGFPYDAKSCFESAKGMADALAQHAYGDVLCLVGYREWFYFGTYTPYGRVYLTSPDDRLYSVSLFVVQVLATLGAAAWMLHHARRRPLVAAVFVYLGTIWAEASLLRPEVRYFLVIQIAGWALAAGAAAELALFWSKLRRA